MKRCVSVLLALVLVIGMGTFALAEDDFTLRNGILFGDTIEDILGKETKLTRNSDDSNWFTGTIAGYSGAECGFSFDDDGKLISMCYNFGNSVCGSSRDTTNDVYKKLYDSVNRQYGKPLGNTGGSCHLITGPAFEQMGLWVYLLGKLDGCKGDYIDYDEWDLRYNDYNVKIDMVSYYYRNKDYDYTYRVSLSYHKYTDADYGAKLKEKQGEREEVDNDI